MADDTATLGSETGASTETQSTESTGQGEVESQGSQGQTDTAGTSQEGSEGGKEQGTDTRRPQFRSKNQTIYELRQGLRERDRQIQELSERFSQFEQKLQNRGQERKPSRTFWEAPEEVLDERITGHLSEMEKRLLDRMEQRDTQSQQTSQWKQETSEAAKLITNRKDMTPEDHEEIMELVRSTPAMQNMRPMERADYALYLWEKQKGITDKSSMKAKASTVVGTGAQTTGAKTWTEASMKQAIDKFPVDPKSWTPEQHAEFNKLDQEFRSAYRDGRVRK